MATGRLPGASPGLQVTRWSKAPSNGTTSLSGVDDYGVGLTYTAGYESVYLNGVLLDRTTDYTATNGTTVVLTTATVTGDIVNIFGTQASPVNGAIPNSIVTTKGDLIVGSSANTPIRKAVGTDGQLLYADSTATGGIKWDAAPSSGGMTLLSTTAASGSTVTISSISQAYKDLIIVTRGLNNASAWSTEVRLNATTVFQGVYLASNGTTYTNGRSTSYIDLSPLVPFASLVAENAHCIIVKNYANTSFYKAVQYFGRNFNSSGAAAMINGGGAMITASALTSISVVASAGSFTAGEILIYGAN